MTGGLFEIVFAFVRLSMSSPKHLQFAFISFRASSFLWTANVHMTISLSLILPVCCKISLTFKA
jgi:hypothetical protein